MPPNPCAACHGGRAVVVRPKNGQRLCRACFVAVFEREVLATITQHALFRRGERVAVGASGGKDSAVLAAVLAALNARHALGLELVLLSVDEGIRGYRDASLASVRRSAARLGLPLLVVSFAELYGGWTMDGVVRAIGGARGGSGGGRDGEGGDDDDGAGAGDDGAGAGGGGGDGGRGDRHGGGGGDGGGGGGRGGGGGGGGTGGSCTYCGVFRRQALDRGAARLGIQHVVTGHNADDIAETVMMNLLRGDLPRLARATSIVTASPGSASKRSKPLKYAYEKEIVLYAHHRQLDYFSTECVYAPDAFRGTARTLIKNLERVRPSAILDVVRSGEAMARLVPPELAGSAGCHAPSPPAPVPMPSPAAAAVLAMATANGTDVGGAGGGGGGGGGGGEVVIYVDDDDDEAEAGGCGGANGRTSGGEMVEMERRLGAAGTALTTATKTTTTTVVGVGAETELEAETDFTSMLAQARLMRGGRRTGGAAAVSGTVMPASEHRPAPTVPLSPVPSIQPAGQPHDRSALTSDVSGVTLIGNTAEGSRDATGTAATKLTTTTTTAIITTTTTTMTAAGVLDGNGKASAGGESRLLPRPEQKNVGPSLPLRKAKGRAVGPRMGQCSLCGYISSQPVCKACTLLQGLNKHRPKLDIEIAPT